MDWLNQVSDIMNEYGASRSDSVPDSVDADLTA
jgi:hypothetical protein